MEVHEFRPSSYWNTFGGHAPALTVHSGARIVTSTVDAHGFDEHDNRAAVAPNPLTGPFEVSGSEPGDCLAVDLEEIAPNRVNCWTHRYLAPHLLEPALFTQFPELLPESLPDDRYADWRIDLDHDCVRPAGLAADSGPFPPIPLAPMLGCIGTAPAGGQAISTSTSGSHGGNMDYVGARAGSTLYFPVAVRGALFYLGDGHATQGHGEIVGSGTEVSMRVQFTLRLIKARSVGWPRGEDRMFIFTIGNARPLDQAVQLATSEMFRWLVEEYELDPTRASLLMGQAVEYEVGNVYDPAFTMVCKLRKQYLSQSAVGA